MFVLLVDDQALLRERLGQILELEGVRVVTAEDGVDAQEKADAADERFDVVITDLRMPRCNGVSLLEALHAKDQYERAYVMTGYNAKISPEQMAMLRIADILYKPFGAKELLAALGKVAAKSA